MTLTPKQVAERVNAVTDEALADGHHVADVGDLLLGCALAHYRAAGFDPSHTRALLLERLRTVVKGGQWDLPS